MIGDLLVHLRDRLNTAAHPVVLPQEPTASPVAGEAGGAAEAVTLRLIRVEEERVHRADVPTERRHDGRVDRIVPDLRLTLDLMLDAGHARHEAAWNALTIVLGHLHRTPVLSRDVDPDLPPGADRLVFTLRHLDLEQQAHLWTALRAAARPHLVYRVGVLTLADPGPVPAPLVLDRSLDLSHTSGGT